mgnify:CR=1 FL=1
MDRGSRQRRRSPGGRIASVWGRAVPTGPARGGGRSVGRRSAAATVATIVICNGSRLRSERGTGATSRKHPRGVWRVPLYQAARQRVDGGERVAPSSARPRRAPKGGALIRRCVVFIVLVHRNISVHHAPFWRPGRSRPELINKMDDTSCAQPSTISQHPPHVAFRALYLLLRLACL